MRRVGNSAVLALRNGVRQESSPRSVDRCIRRTGAKSFVKDSVTSRRREGQVLMREATARFVC